MDASVPGYLASLEPVSQQTETALLNVTHPLPCLTEDAARRFGERIADELHKAGFRLAKRQEPGR